MRDTSEVDRGTCYYGKKVTINGEAQPMKTNKLGRLSGMADVLIPEIMSCCCIQLCTDGN